MKVVKASLRFDHLKVENNFQLRAHPSTGYNFIIAKIRRHFSIHSFFFSPRKHVRRQGRALLAFSLEDLNSNK